MRHYLPIEKKVIDFICEAKPFSRDIAVCDVITKFCPCSIQYENGSLKIFYDDKKYDEEFIFSSILNIVCLFDYLEKESLVYFFIRNNIQNHRELINYKENHQISSNGNVLGQKDKNLGNNIVLNINDKPYSIDGIAHSYFPLSQISIPWSFVEMIDRFSRSTFFCTETLRHIKSQNYQDDATVQHKESQCQAWVAIIVSIVIGIFSTICSIGSSCNCNEHCVGVIQPRTNHTIIVPDTDTLTMPRYMDRYL